MILITTFKEEEEEVLNEEECVKIFGSTYIQVRVKETSAGVKQVPYAKRTSHLDLIRLTSTGQTAPIVGCSKRDTQLKRNTIRK